MPAMTDGQMRALDEHAKTEPALQPRNAPRLPWLAGTELRAIGDAATLAVTADADATYGQPEADLINELKANFNALAQACINAFGVSS
jgi:hypothetical protein